ncbi:DUF6538 domain-containing protein [Roseovarius sp. MMSF_3359]|nr:DUF6538 domain-containing protein [Roseovarius sp. MMSF_3359]
MTIQYVQWRKGLAYYRRRVPDDLSKHYGKKTHLFFSLKTRDFGEAAKKAAEATRDLDREWMLLRSSDGTDIETRAKAMAILRSHGLEPGQASEYAKYDLEPDGLVHEFLVQSQDGSGIDKGIVKERLPEDLRLAAELFYATPDELRRLTVPCFSEVKERHLYFSPKRATDPQFNRSVDRFIRINGDLPIDKYRREHGNAFVKDLLDSGLKKASVKRYVNQVRPIFNTAITELEIEMANPLSNIKIPDDGQNEDGGRESFALPELWAIQRACRDKDDQRRWVISMLSDTGARLAEIAGLLTEDVCLDGPLPYLEIRPNRIRGVKTLASERRVPLVGEALWAANRALEETDSDYLFPDLVKNDSLNNGSVSAALNKWLMDNNLRSRHQPLHSFRHTLRDRLRNSQCLPDVADRIGGWKRQGVGEGYGAGHDLAVLNNAMLAMIEHEKRQFGTLEIT